MDFFAVGNEFNDFASLKEKKKQYEVATHNLLTISNSHKLKGDGHFQQTFVYDRLELGCKAGKERPTVSKGIRESQTYKKNCPVKART